MTRGWIAVDFDGTLQVWVGNGPIMGPPIMPMVKRVRAWIANGQEVRIFTARASIKTEDVRVAAIAAIELWCEEHLGMKLAVTCIKDTSCLEIWDDKAIRVIKNTGLSEREYKLRKRV